MTCKQCTQAAKSVNLALDDEELYHRLSALRTFEDCAELIRMLHASELVHYGDYPSSAVSRAMGRVATV